MRLRIGACLATAMALALGGAGVARAATCDPLTTKPKFDQPVPTAKDILGKQLGKSKLSVDEVYKYMLALDAASPRIVTGVYGTSVRGVPLRYALVSNPANLSNTALANLSSDAKALRDPLLPTAQADAIEARLPAILSVGANVHGNEPSGTEAVLRTMYNLAGRSDCAATQVLDNAVSLLIPTQNPDARTSGFRRNAYWFDLNRDDWARTQPETDSRIELFRKYPPLLFADEHENGSTSYFFPPNTDPVYHEGPDTSVDWMDNLYGPAMAKAFTDLGYRYYTGQESGYDYFAPEYGDTVVSDGFLGAGMTFEKGSYDPYRLKVRQQWVTQWVSLAQGATHRAQLVSGWHDSYVEAYQEGVDGLLEPNVLENPATPLYQQVPDRLVRSYYLRDEPGSHRALMILVRRLQRMDVAVYRLTAPVTVSDFKPYGRAEQSTTMPAGTIWVPMAQGQKHWIQAMLNEDTYIAKPYFYDTTAWSQPLLLDVPGGSSGLPLTPQAQKIQGVVSVPAQTAPNGLPRIAVFRMSEDTNGVISDGWLRWTLDHDWNVPYREVTAADIAGGALDNVDVLLVPDGHAKAAMSHLGAPGQQAVRDFVTGGGRYIGWVQGVHLANMLGISAIKLDWPGANIPGSIYRVKVDTGSPLSRGIGDTDYVFNVSDYVLVPTQPWQVVVAYPKKESADWYRSGFSANDRRYSETAVMTDEPYGDGRVISSGPDPFYRGYTEGTKRLIWNAIVQPDP